MKNTMRKSYFTLVEVLIAMGICVVGVVSIMGLFPVGANASRDTIMVGQAKDAATMILKFYKYCIENGKEDAFLELTGWNKPDKTQNTDSYTKRSVPKLTSEGNTDKEVGDLAYDEGDYVALTDNKLGNVSISSLLSAADCEIKIHDQLKDATQTGTGVYAVKFVTKNDTETIDDTLSIVKTWVTPVTLPKGQKVPRLATFNVEVSWPAELPYEKRQREFYSIDVFCPVTN